MHPKKSTLSHQLRAFDTNQRSRASVTYTRLIAAVLVDYPPQVGAFVIGALRARQYAHLLEWADSYGSAVHATARDQFLASQLVALIKKYPFPAPELKVLARAKAKDKFLAAEKRCWKYNLKFHHFNNGGWDRHADILQRMSAWIRYVIGDQPNLKEIYDECDFGPGASMGVHGQSTNLARKFLAQEWSCTPSALPYARSALAQNFHVWELLKPISEKVVCFDIVNFNRWVDDKVRLVQNNKIVFVPKTTLVDRTIAVEPLLNGYLQKGVDVVLRRRLLRIGLDLRDQSQNQELARQGSIPGQLDPFVTIDLSSASDSISTEVVRRLLPPEWFEFLNAIRSKKYELDGVTLPYNKFVSMGDGFCFPLETLLFASVCRCFSSPGDFIVYGDDIIVRRSVAPQVIKTLWSLGFRHNLEKTFLEGDFRESCGADWFAGHNIRPLTLDYPLDSLESLIKFHNMSLRNPNWAAAFRNVREDLRELVPQSIRFQRPFLGVEYSAFEVPFDMFLSSNHARWNRNIRAWSWLEIERSSVQDLGITRHERYSTALIMGALKGSLSRCPFAKRRETLRTVRRKSHAGATSLWLPLS